MIGVPVDGCPLEFLKELLGYKVGSLPSSYLGVPFCMEVSLSLLGIRWWKGWSLNWFPGKPNIYHLEVGFPSLNLLLSIFQFTLSLFKCPASVVNRIDRLEHDFLQEGRDVKKTFHLVNWSLVCETTRNGGQGIRPLKIVNQALLGKW